MPYTPPTQRSPATSSPNSPILSRNHSYSEQFPPAPVAPAKRPALPRSVSSTSYLNKQHRRSSNSSTASNTAANGQLANGGLSLSSDGSHGPNANGSIRQSPPPVNSLLIPSGAITTPPDSSDDDEEQRGRDIGSLQELQEALQHMKVDSTERGHSPNRNGTTATPTNSVASVTSTPPVRPSPVRSLSAEARKISHSRSSSEMNLSKHMISPLHTEVILSSSEGSDAEDDELRMKPPLLRKKSGELVKPALRPASRRRPSSMPGTPTYSKAVHFNEDIEQVRHFLQVDRPIAVSAGSSPVETYDSESEYPFGYDDGYRSTVPEWEIKLANFPSETFERKTQPVRVERIFLSSDNKTLVGSVAVANIAFQKLVVARFTLDYWKTTSEVVAEYNHDVRKKQSNDGYDRFNFNIKLADQANLASKTLLLCVRYQANGQEFWDSNNSMNYQVDFTKKTKPRAPRPSPAAGAIPRSRHSPTGPRPRSMPAGSFDDDFGHSFDSKFEFGTGRVNIKDSPSSSIRLKPKSKRGSLFPDQASQRNPTSLAFSSRYDFGASLTAALSNAQTALGDRSGIKPASGRRGTGFFSNPGPVPGARPDTLSSDKPGLQSAEYNELIAKFCFFGTPPTGKGSPNATTPAVNNSHTDGAMEYILDSSTSTPQSSASNSPPSPVMNVAVDVANDAGSRSRSPNHFLSRSTSPGPMTGSGPEDRVNSQYRYGYNQPGGIFPSPGHAPQACV
ncbi:putative phosphatase regulatory subunit-domain-containing protein [Dendryphion nanum]|uniref:Phosphatase regulatory subunit-domain-containing protein n=1 Tax=Dendryphion nanum TaxID=256645 RepID=A0A9P9DEV1_9PLEO|nr:putative phosphatase regulatory subunit-domain-containing protein [Dendryphion nanum]